MRVIKVRSLIPVRLDKYLMDQFPTLGLGRLNKALRENKIKLNGKKQPLATRVQNGDEIRLFILDDVLDGADGKGTVSGARCPAQPCRRRAAPPRRTRISAAFGSPRPRQTAA